MRSQIAFTERISISNLKIYTNRYILAINMLLSIKKLKIEIRKVILTELKNL